MAQTTFNTFISFQTLALTLGCGCERRKEETGQEEDCGSLLTRQTLTPPMRSQAGQCISWEHLLKQAGLHFFEQQNDTSPPT